MNDANTLACKMADHRLHRLFNPRSIAVIGASERSPWTLQIMGAFEQYGFGGEIYLVNRRGGELFGRTAYTSCAAIGRPVDVAMIAIPAEAVLDALQDVAAAGIDNAVILSSGFGELGGEAAAAERRLVDFARAQDMVFFGPNSLGYYNARERISVTTMRSISTPALAGSVSLISHSGSIAQAMSYYADQQAVGLRHVIAMGNEAMIDVSEVIEYVLADPDTKAVVLFLETIRNADGFRRAAALARAARKPLIALKVGRSELTTTVAQAHTGAMVGDDRVFDAFCQQYAVVRVDSMEEAIITAHVMATVGPIEKRGVGVVSISGGACEILADAGERYGVQYPSFAPQTRERLKEVISAYGATHNPFDITGAAVTDPTLWEKIIPIVGEDPQIGLTLAVMELVQMGSQKNPLLESIAKGLAALPGRGLFVNQLSKAIGARERDILRGHGLTACFSGLELISQAVGRLSAWSQQLDLALPSARREQSSAEWRSLATEREVLDYLASFGVEVIPAAIVRSATDAVSAAQRMSADRFVLKISSPDIPHKTEAGGVKLNVAGEAAMRAAFADIMDGVTRHKPDARIDGVLVSPMRGPGIELFVGTARDPVWGPFIVVGLGGIWVEALQDTALRLLPITTHDARHMLASLRAAKLLHGFRGAPAVELDAAAAAIVKIGEAALALGPALAALEVNPLLAIGGHVEALDGLVIRAADP